MKLLNLYAFSLLILLFSCQMSGSLDKHQIRQKIFAVIGAQQAAWNNGDIEKYMEGYAHSDSLRFASGGNVSYGWLQTLERYKRGYPDKSSMGVLNFSDIRITIVSKDAALVFGKWQLQREKDNPRGLFTLLFRKINKDWRIVHDHTSLRIDK